MASVVATTAIAGLEALIPANVVALIPRAIEIVGEAVLALDSWTSETTVAQQATVLAGITTQINASATLTAAEKATLVQLCTVLLPEVWTWGTQAVAAVEAEAVTCWGKLCSCFSSA